MVRDNGIQEALVGMVGLVSGLEAAGEPQSVRPDCRAVIFTRQSRTIKVASSAYLCQSYQ